MQKVLLFAFCVANGVAFEEGVLSDVFINLENHNMFVEFTY